MPAPSRPQKKVSFRARQETKCPVCGETHSKEELLSGGGRLIAGKLNAELRRLYEESKKWGKIEPLNYALQVCPKCLYTAYPKDFKGIDKEEVQALKTTTPQRQKIVQTLFGKVDFKENRNLVHGAASYILAVDCYHLKSYATAPTPKKAVSALRAAWLLDELYNEASYRPYDKVRDFYYTEAAANYRSTLDLMQSGNEPVDQAAYLLGPSLDHNWAYDGVIYLNAYLTKKYIDQLAENNEQKFKLLDQSKRYLSKLYGSGKSSKSKPSVIVDMAKDLYDEIGEILSAMDTDEEENSESA